MTHAIFPIRHRALMSALCVTGVLFAPLALAQKSYPTAESAVVALAEAMKAAGDDALLDVLGKSAKPLIASGDPVADRNMREKFVAEYTAAHSLKETAPGRNELVIGKNEWPLPLPLVQNKSGWHFNLAAGKEEIISRRIGANELSTIQAIQAMADAQHEYAGQDRDGDGVRSYARRIKSTPGKQDGLYWQTAAGEAPSPLGELAAQAVGKGYKDENTGAPQPFYGYYYRILDGQGKSAPDGAYSYLVGDRMIGGFAILAYPAKYGVSGVMSFIVNQDGVVYQKNLGAKTAEIAAKQKKFDPDSSWSKL